MTSGPSTTIAEPVTHKLWGILFVAFLLALALTRLPLAMEYRFSRDTMFHYRDVMRVIESSGWAFNGPPMTVMDGPGVPGGLYYNLLQIPLRIAGTPPAAAVFAVFWNILGLVLLYGYFRNRFGPLPTLLLCVLTGSAPYHAYHAVLFWNANFLFPLAVAFAVSLHFWLVEKRPAGLASAIVSIALMGQIHFSALLIMVPMLGLLAVFQRHAISWRHVAIGIALAAISYLPYIVIEIESGFANSKAMLARSGNDMNQGAHLIVNALKAFLFSLLMLTNEISEKIGRGWAQIWAFYRSHGALGYLAFAFNLGSIVVFPGMLVYLAQRLLKERPRMVTGSSGDLISRLTAPDQKRDLAAFILATACFMAALPVPFLLLRIGVAIHYLLAGLPLFGIAFIVGLRRLKGTRTAQMAMLFIASNAVFLLYWNQRLHILNDDTPRFVQLKAATGQLVAHLGGRRIRFVLPDWADAPAVSATAKYVLRTPLKTAKEATNYVYFDTRSGYLRRSLPTRLAQEGRTHVWLGDPGFRILLLDGGLPLPIKDAYRKRESRFRYSGKR